MTGSPSRLRRFGETPLALRPERRLVATAVVMLALAIPNSAQVIPTNVAPPGQRTGMIVGQVVDATTGMPVDEAIVRLTMPKYLDTLPTTPKGRVMADDERTRISRRA